MNIDKWLKTIHYWLMPGICVLCGEAGEKNADLCTACRQDLPRVNQACARCAEPLSTHSLDALCGRCMVKPPAFARTEALFVYSHPVDHLLQQLKFNARLEMARVLGTLMTEWLEERLDVWPDILIPVPLHPQRLRERGFNQAMELARPIGRQLGIPLDYRRCRRSRITESQSGLSRKARAKNINGAFTVEGKVRGHVAIVDDVMTTGSTVNELAKALLKAGADRVDVWVCARA